MPTPIEIKPHMSCSQFKDFITCEAMAVAKIMGTWTPKAKTAFGVGKYVEMKVTGDPEFEAYVEKHRDLIFAKGKNPTKRADFATADRMVERLRNSEDAMRLLSGSHVQTQVELRGIIDDVLWVGYADMVIECTRYVVDLKTYKDFSMAWARRMVSGQPRNIKVPWYEEYQYPFQLWLYRTLLEQKTDGAEYTPFLVGVSKQDPCGLCCIGFFDRYRLDRYASVILANIGRVQAVKRGDVAPVHCGKNDCDYCRAFAPFRIDEGTVDVDAAISA